MAGVFGQNQHQAVVPFSGEAVFSTFGGLGAFVIVIVPAV